MFARRRKATSPPSLAPTNDFSYDGDDADIKAQPVADQGFEPEPPPVASPIEAPPVPDPVPNEIHMQNEASESIVPVENGAGPWSVNQVESSGYDSHDRHIEEEPRSIGIKEDG